jgi:carbamoyl-phosphate synthase large subunit
MKKIVCGISGVGGMAGVVCLNALKQENVITIGMDSQELSAGRGLCNRFYKIPLANDKKFIPIMRRICKKEKIDILIPTVDEELAPLAKFKDKFGDTKVIVSNLNAIETCLDKYKWYKWMTENGFETPKTWTIETLPNEIIFPVIVKPIRGRGSRDTFKCNNYSELNHALAKSHHSPLIQEFVSGDEYTIDTICDLQGKLLSCIPRHRLEIKSGISWKAKTEKIEIPEMRELVEKLGIIGPACIQAKRVGNKMILFEINPRVGGTSSLSFQAGVNFMKILIKLFKNETITEEELKFKELYLARYFADIYFQKKEIENEKRD